MGGLYDGIAPKDNIDILDTDDSTIRAVFHLHITDEDLKSAIDAFSKISFS